MSKQIWKFAAATPGKVLPVHLPMGFRVVSAGIQHEQIYWWAEVSTEMEARAIHVHTIGTGWDVPDDAEYIGTVHDGGYVWHVYFTWPDA